MQPIEVILIGAWFIIGSIISWKLYLKVKQDDDEIMTFKEAFNRSFKERNKLNGIFFLILALPILLIMLIFHGRAIHFKSIDGTVFEDLINIINLIVNFIKDQFN